MQRDAEWDEDADEESRMTKEEFQGALNTVCLSIVERGKEELRQKTQAELETYWFFVYDNDRSKDQNLYEFQSMLDLYQRQCREWETMHHGPSCVVERVRDNYLMPKIKQFLEELEKHGNTKI